MKGKLYPVDISVNFYNSSRLAFISWNEQVLYDRAKTKQLFPPYQEKSPRAFAAKNAHDKNSTFSASIRREVD